MTDGVTLERSGSLGRLVWSAVPAPEVLGEALAALDAQPEAERPRRVEVTLPAGVPRRLRWVLHRHGFRLEGVRRNAEQVGPGVYRDVLLYARLADDPVDPQQRFTAVMNSVTPRKRLIAHALVTDAAGRVLLCETSFKDDWELPGGIVEPFESPATAAAREMVEEMGWAPTLTGVLVVDWLRPYLGWEDAVELVFDTEPVTDADGARLAADGHEIVALHWVPVAGLDAVMTSFGAARARSALAARAQRLVLYTEGGEAALVPRR